MKKIVWQGYSEKQNKHGTLYRMTIPYKILNEGNELFHYQRFKLKLCGKVIHKSSNERDNKILTMITVQKQSN